MSGDINRIEEAMNQLVAAIHSGGSEAVNLAAVVTFRDGGVHIIDTCDSHRDMTDAIMFLNYHHMKILIDRTQKELAKTEDPEAHYD